MGETTVDDGGGGPPPAKERALSVCPPSTLFGLSGC